jgi:uncharacterized protein
MKSRYLIIALLIICLAAMTMTSCKKKTEYQPTPVKKNQPEQVPAEQPKETGKIKVALIIDDFGANGGELLQSFCKLDSNVSFAIMPNLEYSTTAMKKAVASGHETIIHIPMQPLDYPKNDPGKNAILLSLSTSEIANRIEGYIKELPYCIGANNHMGSAVTQNPADMKAVLQVLKKHDMFFIDSATTPGSIVAQAANEVGVPEAKRRIFLDVPDSSPENTTAKIKDLEKIGAQAGTVIVIGHCHNEKKLEQIKSFIRQCKDLGYEFIPISKALPKPAVTA